MLTALKPTMYEVGKTGEMDWYVRHGDPIGYRNMCAASAKLIWGIELEPLKSVRVWSDGGRLGVDGNGIET
jgi:hypothetical protein